MPKKYPITPFSTGVDRQRFGDWLSGFTDGEGCFQLRISQRSDRPIYYRPHAGFIISLRADDRYILEEIRSFLACGKPIAVRDHVGSKPVATYEVTVTSQLINNVIPHFLAHPLRAKKAKDFDIWREAVEYLWHIGQIPTFQKGVQRYSLRWTDDRLEVFNYYVEQLRAIRTYVAES